MQILSQLSGSDRTAPGTTHDISLCVRPRVFALVVDSLLDNALVTANLLADSDFHVTVADNFARAKERLAECPPALLVTEVRLREYNGLQLVLRGKTRRSSLGAIVLASEVDPVLQADAEAMGATFVVRPIDATQFTAAALRTCSAPRPTMSTNGSGRRSSGAHIRRESHRRKSHSIGALASAVAITRR